jgi:hypothetical protein
VVKAPLRFACKLILFREIQWIPIVGGPIRVKLPLGEAEEQEAPEAEENPPWTPAIGGTNCRPILVKEL